MAQRRRRLTALGSRLLVTLRAGGGGVLHGPVRLVALLAVRVARRHQGDVQLELMAAGASLSTSALRIATVRIVTELAVDGRVQLPVPGVLRVAKVACGHCRRGIT
jgi:hypothetical protein